MTHPYGQSFKPIKHAGGWITLGAALLFLAGGSWAVAQMRGRPVSAELFWPAMAALVAYGLSLWGVYRAPALFRLRYFITRNGLEIDWGVAVRRIPLPAIIAVTPAEEVELPPRRIAGLYLPAWWPGRWRGVQYLATAPLNQAVAVQTETQTFILSPTDRAAFIEAWQVRIPLGPTQDWPAGVTRRGWGGYPLWQDRVIMRLGLGAILLAVILVGATMTAYPAWPATIPIRFNALGQAVSIANRQYLLWVALSGPLILLLNLGLGIILYKKDRMLTALLWFVAAVVQIGLWVGIRLVVG